MSKPSRKAEERSKDPRSTAARKCDEFGTDALCEHLMGGGSLTSAAAQLGVSLSAFIAWVESDADRSARAREARAAAAKLWDELAEHHIASAADVFQLSRAKELAHHYRWRAKAVAPRDYGDKVTQEHVGKDGGPIQTATMDLRGLTDEELATAQALLAKAAGAANK